MQRLLPLLCVTFVAVDASSMTSDQKLTKSIVKDFKIIDVNNNGYVSFEEVVQHWHELTKKMNEQQLDVIRRAFKNADTNKDGNVDMTEFTAEVHRVLSDPDFPRRQIQEGLVDVRHKLFNVGHLKSSSNVQASSSPDRAKKGR